MGTISCVSERPFSATIFGSPIRIPSTEPTRSLVVDEIMMVPDSAADATRAALLTVTPNRSSAVRITSPVWTPIRIPKAA